MYLIVFRLVRQLLSGDLPKDGGGVTIVVLESKCG
jgi:hypothetical protein